MNPKCEEANNLNSEGEEREYLKFDSQFESGNLDMVIKVSNLISILIDR